MKIKQTHWHHFFGGVALILLIVQLLSGMVLALFYSPHLNEAYASVQAIYNEFSAVAWIRDTHRWAALLLLVAVIMHFIRSFLRKDYLIRDSKTLWLTGILLYLPIFGFLLTGFILPWEWRGYWFMEMAPNSAAEIPVIGSFLSQFLIDVFTLNRAFVAHVVILPVITLVLMDIHAFTKIKKRGSLFAYIRAHSPLAVPFLIAVAVLAYALPMPSQDPVIIPMPLEGENLPTAEWFILIFYVPYLYFKGFAAALFSIYIPWAIFLFLLLFPYFLKEKTFRERRHHEAGVQPEPDGGVKNTIFAKIMSPVRKLLGEKVYTKTLGVMTVSLVALAVFGPLFAATHVSPTMGCNSCHNISAGIRLGLPPVTFKDRGMNPTLNDNKFMAEHWFYPQVVW